MRSRVFRRALAVPALVFLFAPAARATTPPAPGFTPEPETLAAIRAISGAPASGGYLALVRAAQVCTAAIEAGRKVDCSAAVKGTREIPVLAVAFKNRGAPYAADVLQEQLFDGPNPTGTVTDYYAEISYENLMLTGTVYGWYTLPQNDAFYEGAAGCNGMRDDGPCKPNRLPDLIADAVATADDDIDFALYDNDGPDNEPNSGDDDGLVDFIAFVHSEVGAECGKPASKDNIWSHQYYYAKAKGGVALETADDAFAGGKIKIDNYVIQPALSCDGASTIEVGVFCHEFAHAFGLPDLYDTDGTSIGVGKWDVMGTGCWGGDPAMSEPAKPVQMAAWGKSKLGWIAPTKVFGTPTPAAVNVPNSTENPFALQLFFGAPVPATEYFLVENRRKTKRDATLAAEGLLIWHVRESVASNEVECRDGPDAPPCAATQKVALEQADGLFNLETRTNPADANDPFAGPAKDEFSLCTEPWSANYRRDSLRAIKVSNISTPGPTMTAEIRYTEAWKDLYSLPAGDFGHFVAATGWDYNDDGVDDFLQGLPGVSRANLVSGKDGAVLRDYNGAGGLDRFGGAVAAGDITGDGVPDYAIGAFEGAGAGGPFSNIAGRAYVFDGANGMFLWVALGTSNGDRLGAAVGILEGEGVLVGAPGMGEGGRVILYGPSGAEMNHWDGEGQDDSFGAAIAVMDYGNLGFAVGAPLYPGDFAMANSQRGKVYVYDSGGGLVGSVEGKHGAAQLGASIAYAGRIDRSGAARPLLIAGSPQAFGDGEAYLIDLQAPAIVATFEGESNKGRFGASVAGGADVNGDMSPDLAVGARGQPSPLYRGGAYVFDGRTGKRIKRIDNAFRDNYGLSVAFLGDSDCDLRPDLAVGGLGFGKVVKTGASELTDKDRLQDIVDGLTPGDVGDAVVQLADTAGL